MIKYNVNDIIEGTITSIRPFGAMMIFENNAKGLLHISEIANTFIKNIYRYLIIGKTYQVKVLEIAEDGFMKVSMSKITPEEKETYRNQKNRKYPVSEEQIDFKALKDNLEIWTKEKTNNDQGK